MTQDWKAIVLMALNGSGVKESEALMQIRFIEPMMQEYLKEQREKVQAETRAHYYDLVRKDQRLAVLEEVSREVEKKQEEYQLMKRQTPFQDTLFNHAVNVLKEVSTIIKSLRV